MLKKSNGTLNPKPAQGRGSQTKPQEKLGLTSACRAAVLLAVAKLNDLLQMRQSLETKPTPPNCSEPSRSVIPGGIRSAKMRLQGLQLNLLSLHRAQLLRNPSQDQSFVLIAGGPRIRLTETTQASLQGLGF